MRSAQSSYRDRTHEFQSITERLKKSISTNGENNVSSSSSFGGNQVNGPRSAGSIHSEFNKRASKIGFGIHQTSQKLAKLAKCEFFFFTHLCFDDIGELLLLIDFI